MLIFFLYRVVSTSLRSGSEQSFSLRDPDGSLSLIYSSEIKISEIVEVNSFLELNFKLFAREVTLVGPEDSALLKFLHLCLEICHQNCKDESHFNLTPQHFDSRG